MKLRMLRAAAAIAVSALTMAAVLASSTSVSAATVTSVRSWSAGTISAGQSKSFTWTNANSDIYQANAGGAMTGNPDRLCWTQVTKQTYRRGAGGARQFVLTIKNIDSVSCDVTVYLAIITADRSGSTGVINPGLSKTWLWHNSRFWDYVYTAGVTPNDPGSGTCQLEVTRKNRAVSSGEQQFMWTVRNIGSVACDGQWRLGWLPVDEETRFPDDDPPSPPGQERSLNSPVQDPFRVFFFGLVPVSTSAGNCDWGPTYMSMGGDPAAASPSSIALPTTMTAPPLTPIPLVSVRTDVGYANVGSQSCVLAGVTHAYVG